MSSDNPEVLRIADIRAETARRLLGRYGLELRLVGPADWGSPEAKRVIEAAVAQPAS